MCLKPLCILHYAIFINVYCTLFHYRILQLKTRMHSSQHDNNSDSAVSLPEEEDAINVPDNKIDEEALANVVLTALQAKDLGHSGYVTMKELSSALTSDELRVRQLCYS